jgi:hypothetical protein
VRLCHYEQRPASRAPQSTRQRPSMVRRRSRTGMGQKQLPAIDAERAAERHNGRSHAERGNEDFRAGSQIGKLIPACSTALAQALSAASRFDWTDRDGRTSVGQSLKTWLPAWTGWVWIDRFANAAGGEPPLSVSSGSQQPTRASAGDRSRRARLLTVHGTALCAASAARHPAIAGHDPVRVTCGWLPPGTRSRDWVSAPLFNGLVEMLVSSSWG